MCPKAAGLGKVMCFPSYGTWRNMSNHINVPKGKVYNLEVEIHKHKCES